MQNLAKKGPRKVILPNWPYIVTQAATDDPQTETIRNPAAQFRLGEDIFATGFVVPEEKWREKAEEGIEEERL